MKIRYILLVLELHCLIQTSRSQNFTFAYDNAGNRCLKNVVTLKSTGTVQDASAQKLDTVFYQESLDELKVILYPNPTKGIIIIELQNLDPTISSQILITDNSGKVFYVQKELKQRNQIDLSSVNPGIYFLRIQSGTSISEWKVIKE
jgi:hypothetical protein